MATEAADHDDAHKAEAHHGAEADAHAAHQKHLEHVLHQLQNKPWAALYLACIFFMLISVGVLAFYAIQWAAQAGWSAGVIPCYGRYYGVFIARFHHLLHLVSAFRNAHLIICSHGWAKE